MNRWLIALAVVAIAGFLLYRYFPGSILIEGLRAKNDRTIARQQAYHYGFAAYLYGYPIVDMQKQMHNETHRVSPQQQVYAPVNRLYRFTDLIEPATAGNLRAPNSDTLYFSGWFDIGEEPLVIHTPDTAGRYYTIAVTNLYAEVEHIGRRTTGTDEAYFALVPPHWSGDLPAGVRPFPVETDRGWLLGRMLVDGKDDFEQAMALVNDIWLAPLSEFREGRPPLPQPENAEPMAPLETLEFYEILNRALRSLPPREGEEALMAQFDAIGIGPNSEFRADALDRTTRKALEKAIGDARKVVKASTFRTIEDVNGWMISHDIGRYGFKFMHRAAVVKGGYGNLPEESLYPAALYDDSGETLSGSNAYELRFDAEAFPPVDGFWSLAVYTMDAKLAPNAIERYSIGDRTAGLEYGADGSLTLYLQHEQPSAGEANWLPTPKGGFFAVMRLYEPAQEALSNEYELPRITRVNQRAAAAD